MLPKSVREHFDRWLKTHCVFGFIMLDAGGMVVSWGGDLDRLGIKTPIEERPISELLYFTEGLLPTSEPAIHLPMINIDDDHILDAHLFKDADGYGLLLIDASLKEHRLAKYQQKANEFVLWREKHSNSSRPSMQSTPPETIENIFSACNAVALRLNADNQFTLIGEAPEWFNKFCPETASQTCKLSPGNFFSFFDNFLNEAYAFWDREKIGCIKSGIWIEVDAPDQEHLFEAAAIHTGSSKILMITDENSNIREKQTLIQKGRELALGQSQLEKNQTRLQIAHDELEARVRARTRQIEHAKKRLEEELIQRKQLENERTDMILQLQQAQKMEAIGTLAGGIAHDFNNILSAVVGFTELSLFDVPKGSPLASNLQQVLSAAQRAKALIRQILTFSRQSNPETRPIQLAVIIKEALKLLRASLPASVEIVRNLQSRAYVMADPTHMHQVVMNLCTNAGQAMVAEGGILEIRLRDQKIGPEEAAKYQGIVPGAYLELSVKDNGAGIPQKHLERIFDPFFTTKEKGQGTGMGLSVVHGIVKNCGGDITVSSRMSIGTTFHVMLPAANQTEMPRTVLPSTLPRGNERILFIDDEPMQTDLALKILAPLGYDVTAMTDSAAALKLFIDAPDKFDLVITDMYMPKITGKHLAMEILRLRPKMPIILCSGYSVELVDPTSMQHHFKGHIMKPFLMKEMAETIRSVLDRSHD